MVFVIYLLFCLSVTTFALALTLPVFTTTSWLVIPFVDTRIATGFQTFFLVEAIERLRDSDHLALAVVVGFFTVVTPIIKYMAVVIALFPGPEAKRWPMSFIDRIGKWAMLDVFLVAVLVALFQLESALDVTAELGLFSFAVSVVSSMLVTGGILRFNGVEKERRPGVVKKLALFIVAVAVVVFSVEVMERQFESKVLVGRSPSMWLGHCAIKALNVGSTPVQNVAIRFDNGNQELLAKEIAPGQTVSYAWMMGIDCDNLEGSAILFSRMRIPEVVEFN